MNKKTLYIACLFLLLSAVIYFADSPEKILGTSSALKNEENAVPFSVARSTRTTHYQENGQISYTFHADRLEHYRQLGQRDNVFTLIDKPSLVIYQKDKPWFVRADKGKITSIDQNIELWSKVVLNHTNEQGIVTIINTEKLVIDPINKLANTKEPVRIRSENVELEGVGMDADLTAEKLSLLSNVRGLYDPN